MASLDVGPEGGVGRGFLLFCVGALGWLADLLGPDFAAVDAVVDATHRHHEIFYDKGE